MQQYFYKSNFMSTPGRHIKSYEQVQSLIHEAFMKTLLNIFKERSWMGGRWEKTRIWATRSWKSRNGFLPRSLVANVTSREAPIVRESSLVRGLISIRH